uniref:Coiled-coil domain-containing protein n=1 Tax=Gouania willdenowi TaxID=441366 RepID=A0A8C5I6W8_GOUWI
MAECNVSIDQENLPGVKEVCRDFAVLEDHCLAYNLQEQEIESHLASNVNKSRLVQKDLQVAKKLQEEEDERAKIQSQKDHSVIEQKDIRIAQEIQEELVRQAEHQRLQEEKDAAFARKMQEKEERKRQKQLESNTEEDYFEDHGGRIVHRGSGAVVAENDGLNEATKGILELDLQELKDMEVARKLQEEEMKTSSVHVRAAQVAQDEEIARMLMEKEKKEFKKNREREKEKERERERLAMERRRHEGNYRPHSEEAFRPRPRDEHEHHRHRQNNKPSRLQSTAMSVIHSEREKCLYQRCFFSCLSIQGLLSLGHITMRTCTLVPATQTTQALLGLLPGLTLLTEVPITNGDSLSTLSRHAVHLPSTSFFFFFFLLLLLFITFVSCCSSSEKSLCIM